MSPRRIVIADDHPVYQEALTAIFARTPDIATLPAADSLESALVALRDERPDLALLDLNMPGMAGPASVAGLVTSFPGTRIAIISGVIDPVRIRQIIDSGARGYLPKTFEPDMIVAAVRLMLAGAIYVPPDALTPPSREPAFATGAGSGTGKGLDTLLTPRELDILRLMATGLGNKEIARRLDIVEVTVKLHSRRILEKLQVHNRAGAVAIATANGLIRPAED